MFDEATRALLDGKNFATIATLNSDGGPQTSVVWIAREGDTVVFSATAGRQKALNLARDPRISITVLDVGNPYRSVEIRGTAELVQDPFKSLPKTLSLKYLGKDPPPEPGGVIRLIVRVTPQKICLADADIEGRSKNRSGVLVYGLFQRVECIVIGLTVAVIAVGDIAFGPPDVRILGTVLLVAAALFTVRGARMGLVIDGRGLTERTIQHTRRVPWEEIAEASVIKRRGNFGRPMYGVSVQLKSGKQLELKSSSRISPRQSELLKAKLEELSCR